MLAKLYKLSLQAEEYKLINYIWKQMVTEFIELLTRINEFIIFTKVLAAK